MFLLYVKEKIFSVYINLPTIEKKLQKRAKDLVYNSKILSYIEQGGRYLDVGSGMAHISEQLVIEKKIDIVAYEPNLKPCKKIVGRKKYHKGKIFYIKGFGENLPFKNQKFEGVMLFFVLHHVSNSKELKIFDEVQRVIKPGGYIFIVEDTPENEKERMINEEWDRKINLESKDEKHYYKNNNEWLNFFKKKGFQVIDKSYFEDIISKKSDSVIRHNCYIIKKN